MAAQPVPVPLRYPVAMPETGTATRELTPGALQAVAVLIPARDPEAGLVDLVRALLSGGVGEVLLVDDGSHPTCQGPFQAAAALDPRVRLLRHTRNQGKGRALKTGFTDLLRSDLLRFQEPYIGIVTADADGQHLPEDILRVAAALLAAGGRPVLGVRDFRGNVPFRSRFGNAVMRRLFALLVGTEVSDTQTGLRGLPLALLPPLLALPGERYDYETTVLARLCRDGRRPVEVPIATVYLAGNRTSHFRLWQDAAHIGVATLGLVRQRLGRA